MVQIAHDSGEQTIIKCQQALGDESPLETDENGRAHVSDLETAEQLAALDRHVTVEPAATSPGDQEDESPSIPLDEAESITEALPTLTVSVIEEIVETGDVDDELDELERLEADGKDRKGVYEAIDNRRDELGAE